MIGKLHGKLTKVDRNNNLLNIFHPEKKETTECEHSPPSKSKVRYKDKSTKPKWKVRKNQHLL